MLTSHSKTALNDITILTPRKDNKDSHCNIWLCEIRQVNSKILPLRVEANPKAKRLARL